MRQSGRPLGLVARPSASVELARVVMLVELEHVGHRTIEKGPIVRHDDHAAPTVGHKRLEAAQAVEVQVIGRLVEQGQIKARQDHHGQRQARLLATGEGGHLAVRQRRSEAHLFQGRGQAGIEVSGRQRFVTGQRDGVAVVVRGSTSTEVRRRVGQFCFGGGDPCPSIHCLAHGLARQRGLLLGQVAEGGCGRVDAHGPRERSEEAAQNLQQRRFAHTVGTDHAEAGLGAEGDRDPIKDGPAASLEGDVAGDERRQG